MQTLIHPNIVHYLNVNEYLSNSNKSFETRNDIIYSWNMLNLALSNTSLIKLNQHKNGYQKMKSARF